MTANPTEESQPEKQRDASHLGPVLNADELAKFPAHELARGYVLYRVHSQPPIYYGNDDGSRFYLPQDTGSGTCYLAEDPIPALHEKFWDKKVFTTREMSDYKISSLGVTFESSLRLADCTHPSSSGFGITLEISAEKYARVHPWSRGFFDAGFQGVRFWARHDPARTAPCIALFGNSNSTKLQVLDTETLEESEAADAFIKMKSIRVLPVPSV